MTTELLRFYRTPALSRVATNRFLDGVRRHGITAEKIDSEWCFYLQPASALRYEELSIVCWLLAETFEPYNFGDRSFLASSHVVEIGPRLNFETSWSTNAVSVLRNCGVAGVERIERSLRISLPGGLGPDERSEMLGPLYDRMTQAVYQSPLGSLDSSIAVVPVKTIPLLGQGRQALIGFSSEMGMGWDEQDVEMIAKLFSTTLKRNPTDVELFQIGQANSEHSRHLFFKGRLIIDGEEVPESLIDIVKAPWKAYPSNSLLAFADDSSAIRGRLVPMMMPKKVGDSSPLFVEERIMHPTLTAETHNHPSGIEPYEGAATGSGGRIRDQHVTGRGALIGAGAIGYCTGNLHIPGEKPLWEEGDCRNPPNMASPLQILIQASNGASDYGNCFGEPIVVGFTRTYADKERGWIKPVLYAAGVGQIDDQHLHKKDPEKGMMVVQIGGPAYRIGLGGGSASSMVTGENLAELDFNSVQRGDPEMEQKLHRAIKACVGLGDENPIISVHDLGAGGDCNGLPELVYPKGARVRLRDIPVGDKTLSVLEIWGNEAQERDCLLIWPERLTKFQEICQREGLPCALIGQVTGDGWFAVEDVDGSTPVNLPLEEILGESVRKTFPLKRIRESLKPLSIHPRLEVFNALVRVLRLPSVCSKRFLTNKVDRSVGGLVAQQQCVGPNQLPLSDYAVVAQSHFADTGTAISLGEQPLKGMVSPAAMARMAVAEALLNMVGARVTAREHIKASANWMWPAKLPGEGSRLYDAACAMRDIMIELGIAVDGGKDSLSMAVKTQGQGDNEITIKAPGQLVIGAYATMDDVSCKATPDLKRAGNSLVFIDLSGGKSRLGGSALAQVFRQIGDEVPDVEDPELLAKAFDTVQELVEKGLICSVHDRSDGGLVVTLLEMAFAGNAGLDVTLTSQADAITTLFAEELGLVVECPDPDPVIDALNARNIPFQQIGQVVEMWDKTTIYCNGELVLDSDSVMLRRIWEGTATAIEKLQANPECVEEEAKEIQYQQGPAEFKLTYDPVPSPSEILLSTAKPKVAILREEGSNGDAEMASAFYAAGFEPWDVMMNDISEERIGLDQFHGLAAVGGFSFKDVFDAGKGWAGVIRFNPKVKEEFENFYSRSDTFSLGVCNGCQLMSILGWVPMRRLSDTQKPRFIRNRSERFESRFVTLEIQRSPSIFLREMEESRLGIWVAHGEGQLHVPDDQVFSDILQQNLAPLRYVDAFGGVTETYPFNPNGSSQGIAGLCSSDGRHLVMMPHPERLANKMWQWPWIPDEWKSLRASPWLRLFQNAYYWCKNS